MTVLTLGCCLTSDSRSEQRKKRGEGYWFYFARLLSVSAALMGSGRVGPSFRCCWLGGRSPKLLCSLLQ